MRVARRAAQHRAETQVVREVGGHWQNDGLEGARTCDNELGSLLARLHL
jgi:hypothetical protein